MTSVMENIQHTVASVQQMHQVNGPVTVVGEELRLNDEDIHSVREDHSRVSDALTVTSEDTLTIDEDMSTIDGNQDVQGMARQANVHEDSTGIITVNKGMKLNSFLNLQAAHDAHDLQLSGIATGSGPIPMDAQHYYESLQPAPIMVYGVSAGSIVSFDSLVSAPLDKEMEEKAPEDDLLQSSVSEAVFAHSTHDMSHPLYVLHSDHKKDGNESGMSMDQINAGDGVSPNIVLENRDDNTFSKVDDHTVGMMPGGSEFSLISTSYDNSVTTVANMGSLSMSTVYQSSTDTDSEVALTLASLGNPKIEKIEIMEDECIQNQGLVHSDVIRAASIISGVSDHQQFENNECQSNNSLKKDNEDAQNKPTLVLRSRRNRGTAFSQHQDLTMEDPKRANKRKRKREAKATTYTKLDDNSGFLMPENIVSHKSLNTQGVVGQNESQKENLLGQLLKASEHCEPATLIPEGVVDDVIPAVGYRIMDMTNLSEMIRMMHKCTGSMGVIVIQEQASLREGAVSQLSVICTGCQEGAVCATSKRAGGTGPWDINARVEQLTVEFNIKEDQVQRMLEILGIFYRPCNPAFQPVPPPVVSL
ncbi:hypothetical protein SK128_002704 [Halocaridina rubra]|uniref:Uncharacterized protein n=1 Tax=Halocaridina rubra TaxID=373956 RepID=A0AAN8WSW4_HALRR